MHVPEFLLDQENLGIVFQNRRGSHFAVFELENTKQFRHLLDKLLLFPFGTSQFPVL